jgi:hypothetical protein
MRTVGAMSNEQLERGLQASVKIYTFAQTNLAAMGRGADAECTLSRAEVVDIKKASAAMNRALTALVRESHDAENRLTLELHMLRGIMQREHTDREANRARVFELFRRYGGTTGGGSAGGDDGASLPATGAGSSSGGGAGSSGGGGGGGGGSSNPLNAPSAAAVAFDRALASLERIEQSMRDLSPVGRVHVHGAGLLSAKRNLDGASGAESANKRSKTPSAT